MNKSTLLLLFLILGMVIFAALPAQAARRHGGGGGGGAGPTFESGTFMVGGDFSFRLAGGSTDIEPDEGEEQTTDHFYFDLSGLGGYFVIDGLEIGPLVDFGYQSDEDDAGKTKTTDWSIAAQIAYFYRVAGRFSIFPMASVGYVSYKQEFEPDAENAQDQSVDHSGFAFELRGGAMYGINRHLGVTGALYYRYYTGSGTQDNGQADNDFDITSSEYGIRLGLLGFF